LACSVPGMGLKAGRQLAMAAAVIGILIAQRNPNGKPVPA
jgi:hypothetical protein